jgi:hypothetical protein
VPSAGGRLPDALLVHQPDLPLDDLLAVLGVLIGSRFRYKFLG